MGGVNLSPRRQVFSSRQQASDALYQELKLAQFMRNVFHFATKKFSDERHRLEERHALRQALQHHFKRTHKHHRSYGLSKEERQLLALQYHGLSLTEADIQKLISDPNIPQEQKPELENRLRELEHKRHEKTEGLATQAVESVITGLAGVREQMIELAQQLPKLIMLMHAKHLQWELLNPKEQAALLEQHQHRAAPSSLGFKPTTNTSAHPRARQVGHREPHNRTFIHTAPTARHVARTSGGRHPQVAGDFGAEPMEVMGAPAAVEGGVVSTGAEAGGAATFDAEPINTQVFGATPLAAVSRAASPRPRPGGSGGGAGGDEEALLEPEEKDEQKAQSNASSSLGSSLGNRSLKGLNATSPGAKSSTARAGSSGHANKRRRRN